MILKDYLSVNGITAMAFAKRLGVHHQTLYRNMNYQHRFKPDLAVKVEELTMGAVSRQEALWPEHYDKSLNREEA